MTANPKIINILNAKPFLKWAGGKRALLPDILRLMPKQFNNYFEPFVGGGALFFELARLGKLQNKKAYLFDANKELINTYLTIQNNHKKLIKQLKDFSAKHSKDFYYEIRSLDRQDGFGSLPNELRAARFIYLNKTCFNGLWRVNSKGQHNVPMGSYKNPTICDEDTIISAHYALQQATILNEDFAKVQELAQENDFVYFDPPYYPLNATSSFTAYNENVFLEDEQKRLFDVFKTLADKNIFVMQSNSDTDFIKELYKKYSIEVVECNRFINSNASDRGKIQEVIIRLEMEY